VSDPDFQAKMRRIARSKANFKGRRVLAHEELFI